MNASSEFWEAQMTPYQLLHVKSEDTSTKVLPKPQNPYHKLKVVVVVV